MRTTGLTEMLTGRAGADIRPTLSPPVPICRHVSSHPDPINPKYFHGPARGFPARMSCPKTGPSLASTPQLGARRRERAQGRL